MRTRLYTIAIAVFFLGTSVLPAGAKVLAPEDVAARAMTAKNWKTARTYYILDRVQKRWDQTSKVKFADFIEYMSLTVDGDQRDVTTRVKRFEVLEKRTVGEYALIVYRLHFAAKKQGTLGYRDDIAFLRKTKQGWLIDGEPEIFPMKDPVTGGVNCLAPDVNQTCIIREGGFQVDSDPDAFYFMLEEKRAQARVSGILPKLKPGQPASWKRYSNKPLHFSIKYPNDVRPTIQMNDQYNRLTAFGALPVRYFEVRLQKDDENAQYMGVNFGFLDTPIKTKNVKIGGRTGYMAVSEKGYGDAGGQGPPFVEFGARYKGDVYHVIFYGDAKVSKEEQQILNSFKFLK